MSNGSKPTVNRLKETLFSILTISLPSLTIFFFLCEIIVFRLIWPAAQFPHHAFDHEWSILKYNTQLGNTGTYRIGLKSQIKGEYRINTSGWNSHCSYYPKRTSKTRIVVIGDSYVEALQVDVNSSFSSIIEKELSKTLPVEVYSFGISAAPLSQYLWMMKYVFQKFNPDIAIINIVHNDFYDSLSEVKRIPFFLQFRRTSSDQFTEVYPIAYQASPLRKFLRKSALIRFLYFNVQIINRFPKLINLFKPPEQHIPPHASYVDIPNIDEKIVEVTKHIFNGYKRLSSKHNVKLLLSTDAPRQHIYKKANPYETAEHSFNKLVSRIANDNGIEMLDLTNPFVEDYDIHGEKFNFEIDGHWNEKGHRVVGHAVSKKLHNLGWLEKP